MCFLVEQKFKYLELHKQRRHSEKEHKCEICSKTYDKKEELLNHMSIAHVEKNRPFKLTICLKAFTQKVNRDRHVSGIHKSDVNLVHSKQQKKENNN